MLTLHCFNRRISSECSESMYIIRKAYSHVYFVQHDPFAYICIIIINNFIITIDIIIIIIIIIIRQRNKVQVTENPKHCH